MFGHDSFHPNCPAMAASISLLIYPHVSAIRQVRFSISIVWAWNIETERSRGRSLTNNQLGKRMIVSSPRASLSAVAHA